MNEIRCDGCGEATLNQDAVSLPPACQASIRLLFESDHGNI